MTKQKKRESVYKWPLIKKFDFIFGVRMMSYVEKTLVSLHNEQTGGDQ